MQRLHPLDAPYEKGKLGYIDYVAEDKSRYPLASSKDFIDIDDDFLIGDSGGFLMNISFLFINTEVFSQTAAYYEQHGVYTKAYPDSLVYIEFWKQETARRKRGMTANCKLYFKDMEEYFAKDTTEERKEALLHPLRITGDHYNHLNYGRMDRTKSKAELEKDKFDKTTKKEGFPRFWDGDYWNFKTDEFISKNSYNLCKGKARRKGYSYKRGSQAANTLNLYKKSRIILAAYLIDYLTDPGATTDMVKTNLDWYEENTHWVRGYLSQDLEAIELGYKEKRKGSRKFGWRSKAISVSLFGNASAAIGKDALEIDFEESGKCPNLIKAIELTMSSTEAGAIRTGTIRAYGTGGTEEADWEPFSIVYYNPRRFKMLPLENIYDENSRNQVCGFFHPQILNYEPYIDVWGNSLLMKSFLYDAADKEIAKTEKSLSEYIIYVGQRANTPAEAFKHGSENLFSSVELTDHYHNLISNYSNLKYRDGILEPDKDGNYKLITHDELRATNRAKEIHPFIEEVPFVSNSDIQGCIREFFSPHTINGVVPDNLYYAICDPTGKDKELKEVNIKNSLYSLQIWMYPNIVANSTGDIMVAHYIGRRTEEMEITRDVMLPLLKRYNCKVLPEVDRGNVVSQLKILGNLNLVMRDPISTINHPNRLVLNASYGINIGGGDKADNATIEFRNFLYTVASRDEQGNPIYVFQYISDIGYIKELLKYKKKGNFDRISCGRLAPFARKAYIITKKRVVTNTNPNTTTIGSIYS